MKVTDEMIKAALATEYPGGDGPVSQDIGFGMMRKILQNAFNRLKIKDRWREESPGGCRKLSEGKDCNCTLCLVGNLFAAIPNAKADVHQIPDKRCPECVSKIGDVDGTQAENINDFLEHGGHFCGCSRDDSDKYYSSGRD